MANVLTCSVPWTVTAEGSPVCAGTLQNEAGGGSLTLEEAIELKDEVLMLFITVFVFLVLKKAIS